MLKNFILIYRFSSKRSVFTPRRASNNLNQLFKAYTNESEQFSQQQSDEDFNQALKQIKSEVIWATQTQNLAKTGSTISQQLHNLIKNHKKFDSNQIEIISHHLDNLGNKLGTLQKGKLKKGQNYFDLTQFRYSIDAILRDIIEKSDLSLISLKFISIIVNQLSKTQNLNMDDWVIRYSEQFHKNFSTFTEPNEIIIFLSRLFVFCKNFQHSRKDSINKIKRVVSFCFADPRMSEYLLKAQYDDLITIGTMFSFYQSMEFFYPKNNVLRKQIEDFIFEGNPTFEKYMQYITSQASLLSHTSEYDAKNNRIIESAFQVFMQEVDKRTLDDQKFGNLLYTLFNSNITQFWVQTQNIDWQKIDSYVEVLRINHISTFSLILAAYDEYIDRRQSQFIINLVQKHLHLLMPAYPIISIIQSLMRLEIVPNFENVVREFIPFILKSKWESQKSRNPVLLFSLKSLYPNFLTKEQQYHISNQLVVWGSSFKTQHLKYQPTPTITSKSVRLDYVFLELENQGICQVTKEAQYGGFFLDFVLTNIDFQKITNQDLNLSSNTNQKELQFSQDIDYSDEEKFKPFSLIFVEVDGGFHFINGKPKSSTLLKRKIIQQSQFLISISTDEMKEAIKTAQTLQRQISFETLFKQKIKETLQQKGNI